MTKPSSSSTMKRPAISSLPLKSSKRAKKAAKQAASELPCLPEDVFSVIFEMLLPRDLHRLALTNSSLMKSLSHKTVIRAATLQGGHAASTIASMLELMESKLIHLPSPMRLLRLAVGKRCESPLCKKNRRVHTVRPHFGVFLCADCLKVHTTNRALWKIVHVQEKDMLASERTAHDTGTYGTTKFWTAPYATSGGEPCGPIVCITDVDRHVNVRKTMDEFDEYAKKTASITYDRRHGDHQSPPAMQGLKQVFDDAMAEVAEASLAKSLRKQQAIQVKEQKLIGLVAQVADMVDDKWREDCMTPRWPTCSCCSGPVFESPVVTAIFKPVKDAPSKGTKKQLRNIAEEINDCFETVHNCGFHDLSFLSQDEASFPFEAHLRAHLSLNRDGDRSLKLTIPDIQALKDGEAFQVLKRTLWTTDGCCVCVATNTMMHILVSNGPDPGIHRNRALDLARDVWRQCGTNAQTSQELLQVYADNYKRSLTDYTELATGILEFLNDETTLLFLEEPDKATDQQNERWKQVKTRVVHGLWTNHECWELLRAGKDHEDILCFVKTEATARYDRQHSMMPLFGGLGFGLRHIIGMARMFGYDSDDDNDVDNEDSDDEDEW